MRMQGRPVWQLLVFLANAILFVLIGLQLPIVLDALETHSAGELAAYALIVCLTVVGLRLLWLNTMPLLVRALDRRPAQRERRADWRLRLIVGWSGMRGAVSMAAALSIPLVTETGEPFPDRELILFLAFSVILFTVVIQGLTLPAVIRRMGIADDGAEEHEEVKARTRAAEAALERLEELGAEDWVRPDTAERARRLHEYRLRRFHARRTGEDAEGIEDRSLAYQRLMRELLEAQRRSIVAMRNEGLISNDVMTRIERELDLEDSRLEI
jgi:CPA1 family monovalent cation:H+ antiporter